MKFYEAAKKVVFFRVFSVQENGLEWIFECFPLRRIGSDQNSEVFSIPKKIRNGIPRFFLLQKWFGTEFRGFSHPEMIRNGIPRVFFSREMIQCGIPRVFLF